MNTTKQPSPTDLHTSLHIIHHVLLNKLGKQTVYKAVHNHTDAHDMILINTFAKAANVHLLRGNLIEVYALKKALKRLTKGTLSKLPDDCIDRLVNYLDSNNDGVISAKEFRTFFFSNWNESLIGSDKRRSSHGSMHSRYRKFSSSHHSSDDMYNDNAASKTLDRICRERSHDSTASDLVFHVGDMVECVPNGGLAWCSGIVCSWSSDATYTVQFNGGGTESGVTANRLRLISAAKVGWEEAPGTFTRGDFVEVRQEGKEWCQGVVSRSWKGGTYSVEYFDGSREAGVPEDMIRRIYPSEDGDLISIPETESHHTQRQKVLEDGILRAENLKQTYSQYEFDWQRFSEDLSNSLKFSRLFDIDTPNVCFSKEDSFAISSTSAAINELKTAEKERRRQIDEAIADMKLFSSTITQHRNERGAYKEWYAKCSHNAILPLHEEILRAHSRRRRRGRALCVLLRFFVKISKTRRLKRALWKLILMRRKAKKKITESDAVLTLQSVCRMRHAYHKAQRIRASALLIQRSFVVAHRRNILSEKMNKMQNMQKCACILQARIRGMRGRRIYRKLKREQIENKAALKIQSLYRRKYLISDVVNAALGTVDDDKENDIMVLNIVPRPPIGEATGYWVEVSEYDGGEGLVESVDISTGLMVVNFGDDENPDEYEIAYDNPDILNWFRMHNAKEQQRDEWAVTKIQALLRGRRDRRNLRLRSQQCGDDTPVAEIYNNPADWAASRIQATNRGTHVREQAATQAGVANDDDDVNLIEIDSPPTIGNAVGYWVATIEDSENEGRVDDVDVDAGVLVVLFNIEGGGVREERIRYDTPGLIWLEETSPMETSQSSITGLSGVPVALSDKEALEKAVTRVQALARGRLQRSRVIPHCPSELLLPCPRPIIDVAKGYFVKIGNGSSDDSDDSGTSDVAAVVDVDMVHKMLKIRFVDNVTYGGKFHLDNDIDEVPYASNKIEWMTSKFKSTHF